MLVTLYKRPHGATESIDMQNILPDDVTWFEENNVEVSLEEIGMDTIVYADCGFKVDDDPYEDPAEVTIFVGSKSCEETMTALRLLCKEEIKVRKRF